MRNKITIIVCILLVVCIAMFATACQPKDADGLIKLSTPKNLALNGSVLSWDEVKNAKEYFISINGEEQEQSVTNTTCDLSLIVRGYGNFSIAVRAYGDGEKYGTSDKSSAITYRKGNALDTPIVTITDKEATWSASDRAVNYSVKVTDRKGKTIDELTTESLSYSFDDEDLYGEYGEYILSVIANPASDDTEYSPSTAGIKSYYNSTVLAVPEFSSMSGTTISWKAVSAGGDYKVTYTLIMLDEDGNIVGNSGELSSTSYAYRNKFNFDEVGKYIFKVRANGDNNVYLTSPYSEENEDFVINKLAPIEPDNIKLNYANDGSAKLSWKISADSKATEIALNFGAPNLTTTALTKTISNNLKFVEASTYDFYKYDAGGENGIAKQDGTTILVYRDEAGDAIIRYNSADYSLQDADGKTVTWANYSHSANKVDIIFDTAKSAFVYDVKEYHNSDGHLVNQDTLQLKVQLFETSGKPRFYWDSVDGESDLAVNRGVEYGADGTTIIYHTFELMLNDVFIKDSTDSDDKYTVNDEFYGKLYDVSLSANRNDSNKYIASQSVTVEGQYMSYKVPEYRDGKYIVTNAGEYAYIILNAFINPGSANEYSIENNIDFNGYEIAQIANFKGIINGNNHIVSNILLGNKVLTADGVMKNDNQETLQYAMFADIDSNSIIRNVFYVGMSFAGYDLEKLSDEVKTIQVAPIAINNNGTISNALVQINSIKAESADVAGMVINNNGTINTASVYATLEGRNVGGVMINNKATAEVSNVGFYGKVIAAVGKVLPNGAQLNTIGGAGFVVNNEGKIENSFAIGDIDDNDKSFVSVTAEQLSGIYAGGFVAINSGSITNSYSGEFTLNNIIATVTANGNNAYAGGFVGYNDGAIESSYSTNEGAGSIAGGFAGFNGNSASIISSYSTGGARNSDENSDRGAFVGRNEGTNNIVNCASYSRDGRDNKAVAGVTSTDSLEEIVGILYGENEAKMGMVEEENGSRRYRNPIIKGLIYTKDNTLTARPGQTGNDLSDVLTRIALLSDDAGEITVIVHGNNTGKGNKIVIELKADGDIASRYIYGNII